MSFTNEEQIEEILIESHSYGIRLEVMEEARAIMGSDPKLRKVDAYESVPCSETEVRILIG